MLFYLIKLSVWKPRTYRVAALSTGLKHQLGWYGAG